MKSAYPQTQNPVSIRLYANIPFDNTYEHHSLISDWFYYNGSKLYQKRGVDACESFIDRRRQTTGSPYYYPRWDKTDTYNFDFQNGLVGSVTLELTPEQTNANYMRVTCGSDIYYYFITGIKQVNFETYTLTLELDVLMTYQDEFLEGVKDIPMMTDRKHCHRYTNDGITPHCADFKTGDSVFAGVKPSIIEHKYDMEFVGNLNVIKGIHWLYACVDTDYLLFDSWTDEKKYEMSGVFRYSYKDTTYPLSMIAIPLNVNEIVLNDGNEDVCKITKQQIDARLNDLIGSGHIHACKISPYPPFNVLSGGSSISVSGSNITITNPNIEETSTTDIFVYPNEKTTLYLRFKSSGYFIISQEGKYSEYDEYKFTPVSLSILNVSAPSITSSRKQDPKLLFNPFKKYVLSASYSEGNEFFPELIYSDGVYKSNNFSFNTIYNSYIGDYSIFTYLTPIEDYNDYYFYNNYKNNNIGVSASVNYVVPSGTNALDVFNSTQAQSFYQSKTASGITSGLSIIGGIGSIALGMGMTATSGGGLTPMGLGMVAGGVTAIAGGLASGVEIIKSTQAKIEDLKNTPDAINVQGGSYVSDYARNEMFPFVVVYTITDVVKEQANDFFYNYGYQVARDCYFNTELAYDNDSSHITDNNIFGRTIFNYVKLNEDITNKINANIPQLVKQKLSQVFNKGITLWSFFGLDNIWNDNYIADNTNPDNWFMKHNLDNTEYQG